MKIQFLDLPNQYCSPETAAYMILPVDYDGTSTYGKGADRGPNALLEASRHLELYDIETNLEGYKAGIFTRAPGYDFSSPESMVTGVKGAVQQILKEGRLPVVLGGEHSVSIGAIQAASNHYGKISVLQLDAHSDLRDSYEGSNFNHACVMARAQDTGSECVQVGIRSMDIEERNRADKNAIYYAKDIHDQDRWMDSAIDALGEMVYITIDLDVFDPSIMPSTGTPEPGGLQWYQVLKLLKKVALQKKIIGFDIVELCPDTNRAPDFMAAKLLYKIICYLEAGKGKMK